MNKQPIREYSLQEWLDAGHDLPLEEPFVVRGGCSTWPVYQKLNLNSLREIAGGDEVEVLRFLTGEDVQTMTLGEFLTYCETTQDENPLYLQSWHYNDKYPSIRAWFDPPPMARSWLDLAPAHRPWSWVFIGPRNSGAPWHVDIGISSFWYGLLLGAKDWELVPATHAYSEGLGGLKAYELGAPPDQTVDRMTCRLENGDLLFVPPGWAHSTRNLSTALGVSENFINERNYEYVLSRLTALNDPIVPLLKNLRMVALLRTQAAV